MSATWLAVCQYCHQSMRFSAEGWVHTETGQLYVTFVGPDGRQRDDHGGAPIEVHPAPLEPRER